MGQDGIVSQDGLTVLLTNLVLNGRSGTENVVRQLALALRALGHRPICYSPQAGPIADTLRAAAIPVVTELHDALPAVDVIHGHHLPTTVAALARWPETPAIFVCHDFVAWHDTPPQFPAVRRYVAVDETVAKRLRAEGVAPSRLSVVLNQPDLTRFTPGPALPDRPRRALAFAKNHGHIEPIRRACVTRGIALEIAGSAVGHVLDTPEEALRRVDLVFTSALSAIEALACGRGVIVCDGRGLAGWVTPARYAEWRRLNFGLAALREAVTVDGVLREIDRYSAQEASAVSRCIRSEGGVQTQALEYSALYAAAIADNAWQQDHEQTRAALADYVEDWSPNRPAPRAWIAERQWLHDRLGAGFVAARSASGVSYTFDNAASDPYVRPLSGVPPFDGSARWTDGPSALLVMRAPAPGAWQLQLRVIPFLSEQHARQRLSIEVNGLDLASRAFEGNQLAEPVPVVATIPAHQVPDDGLLWIRLALPDAVAPKHLGLSEDPRQLGVALIDLSIEPA
jgi:hypothetical protein